MMKKVGGNKSDTIVYSKMKTLVTFMHTRVVFNPYADIFNYLIFFSVEHIRKING